MLRSALPVAAAFVLTAGAALAQTTQPPPPPTPPRATDPAVRPAAGTADSATQAYRAKQVLGTKVSITGDISIGTVDDIVFNDAGRVEYLLVVNDGKLVTVPWEAAKFNFDKRIATVNITQDQFRAIPTYTVTQYPVFFEPAYRTRVYGWFGLKPHPWHR